jgi:hypothetical protein
VGTIAEEQLKRISIYADAGIRDFLGSAGGTNWMWAALQDRAGRDRARAYENFDALPLREPGEGFDFLGVDYRPEVIGQHAYLRYGDPQASLSEIRQGDGDHVGTIPQALDRILTAVGFAEARFYERDLRPARGELLGSALIFLAYMQTDWAKMIFVFPSAACSPNDCNAGTFNYRVQRPIELAR